MAQAQAGHRFPVTQILLSEFHLQEPGAYGGMANKCRFYKGECHSNRSRRQSRLPRRWSVAYANIMQFSPEGSKGTSPRSHGPFRDDDPGSNRMVVGTVPERQS